LVSGAKTGAWENSNKAGLVKARFAGIPPARFPEWPVAGGVSSRQHVFLSDLAGFSRIKLRADLLIVEHCFDRRGLVKGSIMIFPALNRLEPP